MTDTDKETMALARYKAECAAASAAGGRKIIVVSSFPRYTTPTAVVGLHKAEDGIWRVMMGTRGPTMALPGTLGLPAGYPNDLDEEGNVIIEQPEETVRRELGEETGLWLEPERFVLYGLRNSTAFLYGEPRLMQHSYFYVLLTKEDMKAAEPDGNDLIDLFMISEAGILEQHAKGNVAIGDSYVPMIQKALRIVERLEG